MHEWKENCARGLTERFEELVVLAVVERINMKGKFRIVVQYFQNITTIDNLSSKTRGFISCTADVNRLYIPVS